MTTARPRPHCSWRQPSGHWAWAHVSLQQVQKRALVRMDLATGFVQRHKTRLIHFPRSSFGCLLRRRRPSETVYYLATARVADLPQVDKLPRYYAGFLLGLSAGRCFQVFAWVGNTFGYAPGGAPIVIPRRMDQKHFQTLGSLSVQQCPCCLCHESDRLRSLAQRISQCSNPNSPPVSATSESTNATIFTQL